MYEKGIEKAQMMCDDCEINIATVEAYCQGCETFEKYCYKCYLKWSKEH